MFTSWTQSCSYCFKFKLISHDFEFHMIPKWGLIHNLFLEKNIMQAFLLERSLTQQNIQLNHSEALK